VFSLSHVSIDIIQIPGPYALGATTGQELVRPVLAGFRGGARSAPAIVVLDLSKVEAANASFLKATLLEFLWRGRAYAESEDSAQGPERESVNVFAIVQGVCDDVREELRTVLASERMLAFEAVLVRGGEIIVGRVLGQPDEALDATLKALTAEGSSTAPTLCEKYPQSVPIKATAWNNRLFELFRHRLATRARAGRQWIYSALTKELLDG
jgi:hypothetical protein